MVPRVRCIVERLLLTEGRGLLAIEAEVVPLDRDLLVILRGGRPHIGAIGVGVPRPGLRNPKAVSASSSVLTFPGHKEDDIAKSMAQRLAAALDKKVVVIAGMHWDDLRDDQIAAVVALCDKVTERIITGGEET